MDVAAAEILRLVEENELLRRTNIDISGKLENSVSDTEEMTRLNSITMDMVNILSTPSIFTVVNLTPIASTPLRLQLTEERRKNMLLDQEVFAYREELKKSFATIVQLR